MLIKKYKHWSIVISTNQCYLGWCLVKLNRHIVDLFDTTKEEREELFEVVTNLRDALKRLFKPDLFNYASLGNSVRHLHLHFIPRYEKKRLFGGVTFIDKRWGHNYAPVDKEFKIPDSVLNKIREAIKKNLFKI
jgi:diadenosine tetraphosphate (Ap4A) HIT family hydrolase